MIEAKNGKSISAYSNFKHENEVILWLGTDLRVKSDVLNHASMNIVHLLELTNEDSDTELALGVSHIGFDRYRSEAAGEWIDMA